MEYLPIRTRRLQPPHDDLFPILADALTDVRDGDVVCVTSKVFAIHQGRCVLVADAPPKDDLIVREADAFIPRDQCPGRYVVLTMKEHAIGASAGIDESNADGHYILLPTNIPALLQEVHQFLCQRFHVTSLGIVVTDSHSVPLRYGVTGIALGWYGFQPLKTYIGSPDTFGKPLTSTNVNIPDSLAAGAVFAMGEGDEQTPVCIVRGVPGLVFETTWRGGDFFVDPANDIYAPLYRAFQKVERPEGDSFGAR